MTSKPISTQNAESSSVLVSSRKVRTFTPSQIYGEAGLIYIRFPGRVEDKPGGQKKIGGSRPAFSRITKQLPYGPGAGSCYSLLMGREFRPGRWAILLDFDNKSDEHARSGLELVERLNMRQHGAPCQSTPSGGFHFIFYVDAEQRQHLGSSRTTITHEGQTYNMDVKFTNQLCNCAPTKIEGYGAYKWVKASQLLDIPQLPPELFEMIRTRPSPRSSPRDTPRTGSPEEPPTASKEQLEDLQALCCCLSTSQLDSYQTWISLGMRLKKLGAPLSLWDAVSRRSRKYRPGDCAKRWASLKPTFDFTVQGLIPLAKAGSMEMFERISPRLHLHLGTVESEQEFGPVVIDTPFLLPPPGESESCEGQRVFRSLTQRFMQEAGQKALVVRSRYGSGKTTFMQRVIQEHNPKRVLFVTYRQTLARDIMRNFGQLGFKNYLDAPEHPDVWNSPRLIVQLDSLLNVLLKNDKFICEQRFDLNYDMIVLDESESLLYHFDGGTMENKEIQIWNFFDELLRHSRKLVLMDGDVSQRSLSFARCYGSTTYIKNTNAGGRKVFNLMLDEGRWEERLYEDLDRFHREDPSFRVCVVSQSSSRAVALQAEISQKRPHLKALSLVGTDGGETKRRFMENINETLQDVNVFLYSPVIESGVDITVPVKKVFGVLCGRSNSQRAYLQMLARCRNVEDPRMDVLSDSMLKINRNYNFWRFGEVLELNRATVQTTGLEFLVDGEHHLQVVENERNMRRKTVSVHNMVETLNKNPSVFVNYLRVLATGKGMEFRIEGGEEQQEAEGQARKSRGKNYRVSAVMEAPDIDAEEYERLSERKKVGKTTPQENYKVEKHFWQRFLVMPELDESVLKDFMFTRNLFGNFLALVDLRNHEAQDNLRSANLRESVGLLRSLLSGLGFASPLDEGVVERQTFVANFRQNICGGEPFRDPQRINALFGIRKSSRIDETLDTQHMLLWANALLKPFSLKISAVGHHGEGYRLRVLSDMLGLVQRKNRRGRFFEDGENLLRQESPDGDPFIDEDTGETLLQRQERQRQVERAGFDTSRLDWGVEVDE